MTHQSCSKSSSYRHPTQRRSTSRLTRKRVSRPPVYDPGMCCGSASWQYPKSRAPVEHLSRSCNTTVLERTRIILSSAPVARNLPSALKHTLLMYRSFMLSAVSSIKTLCNCHSQRQGPISQHVLRKPNHVLVPVFVS